MQEFAIVYGAMIVGIVVLFVQLELQLYRDAKAIKAASGALRTIPASRKHIRITHNSLSGGKVTYYNEAGRKVTSRRTESSADLYRFISMARAKGYRTI